MDKVTCPSCGGQKCTPVNGGEYRCEYCGRVFSATTNQCNSYPQIYSQSCQPDFVSAQHATMETKQGKSKAIAGILGIVLGGFGAHQFYLGNIGKGIGYVLLCWTYIPGLIGLIEGILILSQSEEEFAKKPKLII